MKPEKPSSIAAKLLQSVIQLSVYELRDQLYNEF